MDAIQETLPPHSPEAEEAVLGSILVDPDAYYEVSEHITPDSFYHARNRWVYEAITALHARQEPLDVLMIAEQLEAAGRLEDTGGLAQLAELSNAVPTSINAEYYAQVVADKATRRRLIVAAGGIAKAAYNEGQPIGDVLAGAESAVFSARGTNGRKGVQTPRRYTTTYLDGFMADIAAGQSQDLIKTGFTDLDALLLGLEAPHQYMLAGRPGMGKSALMLSIVLHIALRLHKRVLLFSLEMSEKQLLDRLISMMTNIPTKRLRQRWTLTEEEQARVMEATARISDSALLLDCTEGLKPSDIRARATRAEAEHGLDLIIVDHMHIMAPERQTNNRVLDLGDIAIQLASTYKALNAAGLTLAQLSRGVESRAIKIPMLSDLRESGQIEENAYAVMFLYRGHYYDNTEDEHAAKLVIAKHRDGETGSVDLFWNPERAAFYNLEQVDLNPPRPIAIHTNGKVFGTYQH